MFVDDYYDLRMNYSSFKLDMFNIDVSNILAIL
jgi:hypothetical protein